MIRKLCSLVVFAISLSFAAEAQEKERQDAIDQIRLVFYKSSRPLEADKNRTVFFSVRYKFKEHNMLDSVFGSEFLPAKMKVPMTDIKSYQKVKWQLVMGRNIVPGESLVIPFGFYDKYANTPVFNAYTLDGLFNYNTNERLMPVTLMQPLIFEPSIKH